MLGLSTGPGQGIAGVCGVFDRIAAGFGKYEFALGKVLPFRVGKLCHIDSSGLDSPSVENPLHGL